MQDDEKVVIVTATGSLDGSAGNSGTVSTNASYSGNLAAVAEEENVQLSGTVSVNSEMATTTSLTGGLSAKENTNGATVGALSIRIGQDGVNGKDGFSPTITVDKDTKTEYVLKITDINGSYLTPNLIPDIEGLQDIEALVAGKVDEDLKEYPVMKISDLTQEQKESTFLYVRTFNGLNRKASVMEIALEPETTKKIQSKIQTVEAVPATEDWNIGDYILLDDDGNKPAEGE